MKAEEGGTREEGNTSSNTQKFTQKNQSKRTPESASNFFPVTTAVSNIRQLRIRVGEHYTEEEDEEGESGGNEREAEEEERWQDARTEWV